MIVLFVLSYHKNNLPPKCKIVGGFESSSSTMSFCMFELAKHPEIQQRVYDEIVDVIHKHGGLTYDAVSDMKYLGQCLDGEFYSKTFTISRNI